MDFEYWRYGITLDEWVEAQTKARRTLEFEKKTLEAVVGELPEGKWKAILKVIQKYPRLSAGEVYMDWIS